MCFHSLGSHFPSEVRRVVFPTEEEPVQATAGQFPQLECFLQPRPASLPSYPMAGLCTSSFVPQGCLSCAPAPVPSDHLLFQDLFSEAEASGETSKPHSAKHSYWQRRE